MDFEKFFNKAYFDKIIETAKEFTDDQKMFEISEEERRIKQ